jgi:predicted Zn-dependent protease
MKASKKKKRLKFFLLIGIAAMLMVSWSLSGCRSVEKVSEMGAVVGVATGLLTDDQAESLRKSTVAVAKSFQDFTPEQEYYLGRSVGAMVLHQNDPYPADALNRYINLMGQSLAMVSDLPETFGGYHFMVLDSEEINAFASPGGLIFVTKGLLRCSRSEDALAAVLAHEIGHVQNKHGLQAIKKSRITSALTTIGIAGAKSFAPGGVAQLAGTFEDSISDITKTLINSGYSREFERQADLAAVKILERIGYGPSGLVEMLKEMEKKLKPGGLDFAKTHPSPQTRIKDIEKIIGPYRPATRVVARQDRFNRILESF